MTGRTVSVPTPQQVVGKTMECNLHSYWSEGELALALEKAAKDIRLNLKEAFIEHMYSDYTEIDGFTVYIVTVD